MLRNFNSIFYEILFKVKAFIFNVLYCPKSFTSFVCRSTIKTMYQFLPFDSLIIGINAFVTRTIPYKLTSATVLISSTGINSISPNGSIAALFTTAHNPNDEMHNKRYFLNFLVQNCIYERSFDNTLW